MSLCFLMRLSELGQEEAYNYGVEVEGNGEEILCLRIEVVMNDQAFEGYLGCRGLNGIVHYNVDNC